MPHRSHRFKEVRIARRVMVVLYFIPTLWLCLGVTISIVWALSHEGETEASVQTTSAAQGGEALAELRTLFQELRQRAESIGRGSPDKRVDLTRWDAWAVRWRERLDRVGARYGISGSAATTSAGRALEKVFRAMRELESSY